MNCLGCTKLRDFTVIFNNQFLCKYSLNYFFLINLIINYNRFLKKFHFMYFIFLFDDLFSTSMLVFLLIPVLPNPSSPLNV